jgi:hypothetical protein
MTHSLKLHYLFQLLIIEFVKIICLPAKDPKLVFFLLVNLAFFLGIGYHMEDPRDALHPGAFDTLLPF